MRRIIFAAAVIFFLAACLEGAELPRARLDESERQFNRAYRYFLDRDYWSALEYLDRALRANTYLVDYYLLDGLTLQRTGNGEGARAALANYLEVRPMDAAVPRIARAFLEQDRLLRSVLGTRPLSVRWQLYEPDIQTEWHTGYSRPFNIRGLGKAESFGETVCLADTLGNHLYLLMPGSREFRAVPVPLPEAAFPMGDGTFTVFCRDGALYSFSGSSLNSNAIFSINPSSEPVSPDFDGQVNSHIADAEWISENEFAVADPVARNVAFYDRQTHELITAWAPPTTEMLFEPVALDGYADWLAIADRGNGRVYLLNSLGRREFFSAGVPMVRDVLWSPLGELFALTEQGELFRLAVDFGERTATVGEPMASGLEDIWSFFLSGKGDVYCITVSGSKLYRAAMLPSQTVNQGFLGLYRPVMALEAENRESFLLNMTLGSPFAGYSRSAPLVVHSIWNERTIRSAATWQDTPAFDGLLLHRPLPQRRTLPTNLRQAQVERGLDVQVALPSFWVLHRETLTNIIVDSSIPFSMDELLTLTRFCLVNGLEMDVWARETPSLELARASAFTGGRTLFSLQGSPQLSAPQTRLQLQIPLPQELASSGYPGRSMLSVYLDIGQMQSRSWIPLWPDMLGR